jgi:hypothetical protein
MGFDYGRGLTNIDRATGIRFGVLPQSDLGEWSHELLELVYGKPHCPKCGDNAQGIAGAEQDFDELHLGEADKDGEPLELQPLNTWSCADYGCAKCGHYFGTDEASGTDEPIGVQYVDDGYRVYGDAGSYASSDDLFVELSPYFTFAPFCSPCAPGAVYLRNAGASGDARGYCFGHEWFSSGVAPYPVFDVATGAEVYPVGLSF